MLLPLLLATIAFPNPTDGVISPTLEQAGSPLVRSNEPSPWRAFSATTIASESEQFRWIAQLARDTGQDVLVKNVPLGSDLDVDLVLHEVSSIHEESRFVLATLQPDGSVLEQDLPAPQIVVLAGHVAGDPDSRALLAEGDLGTMGYVRHGERTFLISSGPQQTQQPTLSFEPSLMPKAAFQIAPLSCTLLEIDGHAGGTESEGGIAGGEPCRKMGFALETDTEYLSSIFGGNENSANAWAALLLAASTDVYEDQFNAHLEVDYIRLWSGEDPWSATNTSAQLTDFRTYWENNMGSVDRDLAHFLSGRGLGGGVAWLGGLCGGSYAYALSANLDGFFPYPLQDNSPYNWDIMVFMHETGHSFGTGHTHDSYNPPIDDCAGGDCSVTPNGTIMSYCHLCSGGLSNILLEFHPRVEDVVINYINSVSCDYTGAGEGAVAVDDEFSIDINQISTLDVLLNDAALSCGAIYISDFDSSGSQGGLIELIPAQGSNGRDKLLYTPNQGFTGTETFSYTIADSVGNQAQGDVSVTVATNVYFYVVGGDPTVIFAEGQVIEVNITPIGVTVDTSSCIVVVDDGNGPQQASLTSITDTYYRGTLPDLDCPGTAEMYLSIQSTSGGSYPSETFTPNIGFEITNFEGNCCLLWEVTGDPESTDSGIWEIGTPDGNSDRGDPAFDYDGSGQCYLTGAGTGNTDVDGGSTILESVRFVADEYTVVTWAQWYDNSSGASPGADVFTVEITNDYGETWALVEEIGPSDSQSSGGWFLKEILVSDYVVPTTLCRMRWTASDVGSGSVIEAAIDAYGAGECTAAESVFGDLNGDGLVSGPDLSILLGAWSTAGPGDLDNNGIVNGADLASLLGAWTG